MTDAYSWWRSAIEGVMGPVHDGAPQAGFFRRRKVKDGPWLPVAFYPDDAGVMCCVEGGEFAPVDANEAWLKCARHPVSEEAYREACATGRWPGDAPASAEAAAGHNQAPEGISLPQQIEEAVARAKAWLLNREIVSQADSDRVETFVVELSNLAKSAESQREGEVKPHLEAQRTINATWKPIVSAATDTVRDLKRALGPYLQAREKEKKEAAAKAIAAGSEAARIDTRAATSGSAGRRVSLRTQKRAVIKDFDAALMFFKDHPEVRELVQKLANKVAGVGGTVPGVEIATEQVAA